MIDPKLIADMVEIYTLDPDAPHFTADGLLQNTVEFAEEIFDQRGEVFAMFIAASKPNLFVVPTPWGNEDDKKVILAVLRRVFKKAGVTHYAMLSETWVASVDPETEPKDLRPAGEYPDRREAVSICVADRTGCVNWVSREIERPLAGKPRLLPAQSNVDGSMFSGRMTELLVERH